MSDRIFIDRLEFYITNVCNLTCDGCNRYNNYHFKGWQAWDDYAEDLEKWSKRIEIRHPVILGGEPLLNPDITKWITGINRLWPEHSGVQVQSNGTRIDRVRDLYDALNSRNTGNWIGISIHNPNDREEIFTRIRNFLENPIKETADKSDPIGSDFQFVDKNFTYVHAWMSDKFVNSNILERHGRFTLYHSDPVRAHENCTFRRFKNYHWIRGRIYKCGPVALMPEFDQQHIFDISDEDRALLYAYRGLSIDEFDTRGQHFLATIDDVIPQCKFCPEDYVYKPITFSDRKKSWRISTEVL